MELSPLTRWNFLISNNTQVRLALPGIDSLTRQSWEASVNEQLQACGCAEGAVMLAVALAGYLVFAIGSGWIYSNPTSSVIAIGLVTACIGSAIGKFGGLIKRQVRLTQLVGTFTKVLAANRI
jgi:hypothetical protein